MTDQAPNTGYGKLGAAIAASWIGSYIMTQFSLHGIDFAVLGFPSEMVKSTIVGGLVGLFTWVTPRNFVESVTNAILFCKDAVNEWRQAINKPEGK